MFNNPEIGDELSIDEVNVSQLVVIKPPNIYGFFFTAWIGELQKEWIRFDCNHIKWSIINRITPDGQILDDQGRQVHIYEYLGEE